MMEINKLIGRAGGGSLAGLAFLASATNVWAQDWWTNRGCTAPGNPDVVTIQGIVCLFERMFMYVVPLVGLAALVVLFFGAYTLMISGGNPQGLKKGWGLITYAILGIVAIIAAYVLIRLIQDFTGVNITTVQL